MNITLAGSLGSGKSTVGKRLATCANLEFISTGKIFRAIGQVSDLEVLQTNLAAETNTDIDAKVDGFIVDRAKEPKPFVMDSRMAWHFVPDSLKVYLFVSASTAAKRIFYDDTRDGETYTSLAEAEDKLVQRRNSEVKRYEKLYGVAIDDWQNYDIVVFTDGVSVADISAHITQCMNHSQKSKIWIPKAQMVPMMTIRELSGKNSADLIEPSQLNALNVSVEGDFGFFYEDPLELISWLHFDSAFIPVNVKETSFVGADRSHTSHALQMSKAHFYDWEEAGGVRINFSSFV